MRKLLQNKLVVLALAGVAVLSVAANFVKLPKRLAFTLAREASVAPGEDSPTNLQVPGETEFSRAVRVWNELYPIEPSTRDPFAPRIDPATPLPPPAVIAPPPGLPPTLVLQAVSIGSRQPFAVINQTVVTEGEMISGYRVERILPTTVQLNGSLGPITVDMERPSKRQTAPSPIAPAAVLAPAPAAQKPGTTNR